MSILKEADVLERIEKPKNGNFLTQAVFQEERLLLHAEPIIEKYNLPWTSFNNFTRWWQSLIAQNKYNRIDEVINCPLFTVGVIKDIFDQLQKFLDAQDRYTEFKFTEVNYTNDYNDYLKRINDDTFWRVKVINELKTGINSYIVIDMPSDQGNLLHPEPYTYFVSPRLILDVDLNRYKGGVEYIIFKQSDFNWDPDVHTINTNSAILLFNDGQKMEKIIVIDDNSYRTYVRQKNKRGKNNFQLLSSFDHNLGYCPVIDFWEDSIKGTNGINKIGPVTLQLSNLDYLLFYKGCIDYMNLYAPFPILNTYDYEANEYDEKTKEVNSGGNWDASKINPISNSPQTQDPRTDGRKMMGPGSGRAYPVPQSTDDHDPMKNPMKFIGMDVDTVEQANKILEDLECKIKEKCTGTDSEYLNEIAKNTEMLAASFRKEETILNWIARNIERVHRFVTDTRCILRYGKYYYKGCVIDYGSDRLLKDATTLTKELKESINNGMPQSYSLEVAKTAMLTRFKNNPEKIAYLNICLDLEPYPLWTFEKCQLLQLNISDKDNFIIKANFATFVKQFELDTNGSIITFGSLLPYPEKIKIIKSKFKEYVQDIKWVEPQQSVSKSDA